MTAATKPSENTSSNNPENTSMTESSSPSKSTSTTKKTTRTRKTMTATTKRTATTTAAKAPAKAAAKPRTRKPVAARKPVVAAAPLAPQGAEHHLNEAKNHLRAAMLILMSHLATRVGRDMEIASAWLKPHWDRFLLSLQTLWNTVPAPMRSLAAEMFPHIAQAIRHLVIALAIIAREEARKAITAATPHAKKAEAEALIWLGSAVEAAEIELRAAMTRFFVKRSNA